MTSSIEVFLSHRYKSPETNLYFFELFPEDIEVQFEVDEGSMTTNVTRLERLVRRTDAFVGIYSLPPDLGPAAPPAALSKASRYFRLELDLAIRAAKPTLVLYDERLSQVLPLTRSMRAEPFNHREVDGTGGSPRSTLYRELLRDFCHESFRSQSSLAAQRRSEPRDVCFVFPDSPCPFSASLLDSMEGKLRERGVQRIRRLAWPPRLDGITFEQLDASSWAIVEVSPTCMSTGIPGYLHGRMVPMLRTCFRETSQGLADDPGLSPLFGGVEVGYVKDIVFWHDEATLLRGIESRLPSILFQLPPLTRINTRKEANDYFRRASLRKESIFLSYSGRDAKIAAEISTALKSRFQNVFDYKDGESIRPGKPWLGEIFDQLATSAVGVPLVSASYLDSGNCMHEAQEMVARRDEGKLELMPVKLYPDDFEEARRPSWMRNIQYLHWYPKFSPQSVVAAVEAQIGAAK